MLYLVEDKMIQINIPTNRDKFLCREHPEKSFEKYFSIIDWIFVSYNSSTFCKTLVVVRSIIDTANWSVLPTTITDMFAWATSFASNSLKVDFR